MLLPWKKCGHVGTTVPYRSAIFQMDRPPLPGEKKALKGARATTTVCETVGIICWKCSSRALVVDGVVQEWVPPPQAVRQAQLAKKDGTKTELKLAPPPGGDAGAN